MKQEVVVEVTNKITRYQATKCPGPYPSLDSSGSDGDGDHDDDDANLDETGALTSMAGSLRL